jgi:hypothetical protein
MALEIVSLKMKSILPVFCRESVGFILSMGDLRLLLTFRLTGYCGFLYWLIYQQGHSFDAGFGS